MSVSHYSSLKVNPSGQYAWQTCMGQSPPGKNTAQLKCRTVKYLHSFEMNQLGKPPSLHPKDVQVSTIALGAAMSTCKLLSVPGGGRGGTLQTPRSLWT